MITPRIYRAAFGAAALATAALTLGCSTDTGEPVPGSNAAETFDFHTTREVHVQVQRSEVAKAPIVGVRISNARKETLYTGALRAGETVSPALSLPVGDTEVYVQVGEAEQKVTLVAQGGTAKFD